MALYSENHPGDTLILLVGKTRNCLPLKKVVYTVTTEKRNYQHLEREDMERGRDKGSERSRDKTEGKENRERKEEK